MLYIIGLGLGDPKDITVKGLEAIKISEKVFLESYTSILSTSTESLEDFYGKAVIVAGRETVEQESGKILEMAKTKIVSFLVVGDPFGATTHSDLVLRAKETGVEVHVIHNASIMNAVGVCGLQLYNFGETVSIVMWTDSWKPESFYDKILKNRNCGYHTLCLLDIKMKEKSVENIIRNRDIYEPPRYLTVNGACRQLLEIIDNRRSNGSFVQELAYTKETLCVGLARIGWPNQEIKVCTIEQMCDIDLGPPLHSLIIPATSIHPIERDMLRHFAIDGLDIK